MNVFRASPSVLAEAAIKIAQGEVPAPAVVVEGKAAPAALPVSADAKGKAKAGK